MEKLLRTSSKRIRQVPINFLRYLYHEIDWNDRLIAVIGSRGTGKTTLMLQYIKLNLSDDQSVLYITLDDLYFSQYTISDLVETFVAYGGKYLFLDEVHKYKNWSLEIKNIYDTYSELKIVFSGSSLLQIYKGQADLSRRVSLYHMHTLSFREFLAIEKKIVFPVLEFEDILKNHIKTGNKILNKIKPLELQQQYLKTGMYPFFLESKSKFTERLLQTVNQVLETDIPQISNIEIQQIKKLKQLLYVISTSAPFKPNISKLAVKTDMERRTIYKYLNLLEKANLINTLHHSGKGISVMSKPEKIYLNNTNLMWLLSKQNPNIGNIRETFFFNQLQVKHKVNYSKETDFIINNTYHFEIGGKNKQQKQIKNLKNAFIIKDNIETGMINIIPLWLFGFLY